MIIEDLNRRIKGWGRYFWGGDGNVYERLDQNRRTRLSCACHGERLRVSTRSKHEQF